LGKVLEEGTARKDQVFSGPWKTIFATVCS
jgi:hypothetical protein